MTHIAFDVNWWTLAKCLGCFVAGGVFFIWLIFRNARIFG